MLSGVAYASEPHCIVKNDPKEYQEYYLSVTPRADIIVWKYKSFDGRLHKRKYNQTRGKWIGDWIPT